MAAHCGIWTHDGCIPGGRGRLRKAGLLTADHGMKRRVEATTVESTGITNGFAGSGFCSAGMLSSATASIAALVVSSRAASRLYSRVTTKHESVLDRATAQRTAVQSAKGRLLRKVISSNECTGALRIDESGAPSARIPGQGFKVVPTLGPPIKGTAAEDAQFCTSARTILLAAYFGNSSLSSSTRARTTLLTPTAIICRCI